MQPYSGTTMQPIRALNNMHQTIQPHVKQFSPQMQQIRLQDKQTLPQVQQIRTPPVRQIRPQIQQIRPKDNFSKQSLYPQILSKTSSGTQKRSKILSLEEIGRSLEASSLKSRVPVSYSFNADIFKAINCPLCEHSYDSKVSILSKTFQFKFSFS